MRRSVAGRQLRAEETSCQCARQHEHAPPDPSFWQTQADYGHHFTSWVDGTGATHPSVDIFGNPSITLGGGPPGDDDSTYFCLLNSRLVGKPNRLKDDKAHLAASG